MTKIKEAEEQELLQMIVCLLRAPPFLSKWSFAKSTVLQMTKIKGTEEQELLQIIIRVFGLFRSFANGHLPRGLSFR